MQLEKPRDPIKLRKRVVKSIVEKHWSLRETARAYRTTVGFVRYWVKRYKEDPEGEWWRNKSKRPKNIQRKVDEETRKRIVELRRRYKYNIMQISKVLEWERTKVSHVTIQKILEQEGEEIWSKKKRKEKAKERFERAKPNDLWQIDFKGPFWVKEQGQHLYMVNIIDDHSRFLLFTEFYTQPLTAPIMLEALKQTIKRYGKPREILTDNGSQFYSVRGGTSTFTRWCLTKGIKHIRSRAYHPQTCGKVERVHGTILRELHRRSLHLSSSTLHFNQEFYNFCRPHQGIDLSTPGERFMNTRPTSPLQKKCAPSLFS